MVKLLIEKNANASIKNIDNLTAIDICFSQKEMSLIKYFRSVPHLSKLCRVGDD